MMKRMISALALAFIASSVFASGTVTVFTQGNSEPKTLTDAERLLDLVGQPRLATSWWPAAALGAEEDGDAAAAINTLRRQIQAVKVTGRQLVNLDPDVVRVSERGNPPLKGHYTLWVGPQPTQVTLFGLISQPGSQPFVPGRDVASYLEGQRLLSGADRSYAWVVYPDGRSQKAPVAYWNKRHIEPMPGSIIFVGFADSLWRGTPKAINADILHTLTQRIPE
ncbi:hypothetical protein RJ11_22725 [Salmonella enterica subsp. enterica serovar Enteritidis]|nr:hypothetical protein [Salmonella enterica subsp. enterica serovar Enteritidis]